MRRVPLFPLVCLALLPACKDADSGDSTDQVGPKSQPSSKPGETSARKLSDACDEPKLTALTTALAAAKPGAGPDLVAEQLGEACELPSAFASFFALSARPDGGEQDVAVIARATKDARDALAVVCPDAVKIRKQQAGAPQSERQGLLYDRCDFQRFGLADKEAWLRGDPSSPVPFFAHHWLTAQGVADADATAIAHSMILRDRKQWALVDQELPSIAQPLAPIPKGTVVHVSPTHMTVNEEKIVTLAEGKLDPASLQGHLIGPLFDVLSEQADAEKHIAESMSEDWRGTLVLVADASTPQAVLVDIMYSAGRAEFSSYAFVGESAPYTYGAIPVDPPKFRVKPQPEKPVEFVVHVTGEGFRVRGSTSEGEATLLPKTDGDALDFAALTAAAQAHKKAHPKATVARVRADDDTRFGVFTKTLATLSGAACQTAEKTCLLPTLVVEAVGTGTSLAEEAARQAGLLGMVGQDGHFLASPYGGAFAVGDDDEDVWGGLTGSEVGEAFGAGGLGLVGTGRGGGGTGEGSIGLGNTGLIGKGGGGGSGSGYGRGEGAGFGGRGKAVPRVRQGKATVSGSLDKDIIRRIVRAHINEVRHCYNLGLADEPKLSGGVTIDFTIDAAGKVSASSVGKGALDDDVGTCVAKAVKRWKFPKPSDGGTVGVVYPFELEPG